MKPIMIYTVDKAVHLGTPLLSHLFLFLSFSHSLCVTMHVSLSLELPQVVLQHELLSGAWWVHSACDVCYI